jgi:5'-deoxynucleotidase
MKVKGLNKFVRQLMSRSTAYLMRWHHRAVTWRESVAEHHALTARMSYEMGTILVWNGFDVRPEKMAMAAMYHDEEELIVGDMPSPAKKLLPPGVLEKVASAAIDRLWPDYPDDLAAHLRRVAHQTELNEMEQQVVEYADKLAAFSYVLDTVELGNQKMIDILDHISSDEYLKSMDWDWLMFLRKEHGLP